MSAIKYTQPKDINFEEFKDYYESHSREETLAKFNLNIYNLQKVCELYNYKRPKEIVNRLRAEKCKQTCLEKYGVISTLQLKEIFEKTHCEDANKKRRESQERYLVEHYGVHNIGELPQTREAFKTEEFSQKMKDMHANRTKEEKEKTNEKRKKTCLEKYGVPYFTCTQTLRDASHTEEAIAKANASRVKQCLEKNGVEYYSQLESFKEKRKKTCLEKYGVDSFSKTDEFASKRKRKYACDGLYFDSSWELAFYIYHKDLGSNIIREPCKLEYIYNNRVCFYFPDFMCNGELIEIKGDHFFKGGELVNIYDLSDTKTKKKYECALQNGVKFIFKEDIKFFLDYIKTTYGRNYLKTFLVRN